jgi:DNA helicase HerA-like ATPase
MTEAMHSIPESVVAAMAGHALQLGGVYEQPPGYEGSIGRTMFDMPSSQDNTVTVLVPPEDIRSLPSQALVRIKSLKDSRSYVGIVVAGPFAEPDGLRADSAVVVTTTVRGASFMPNYHGRVQVEIMGEEVWPEAGHDHGNGGQGDVATHVPARARLLPPRFRPLPNSPVFALDAAETQDMLHCHGDMRLGLAVGHEHVVVEIPSHDKDVLPRHTGILGTTGGGKSTTVAGLIAQMQAAGIAVVLLDTEGEYTHLNEPAADPAMLAALRQQGRAPTGVPGTTIYHVHGRDSTNPQHPRRLPFCLWFMNLAPHIVAELLDFNDAQVDRFLLAYDVARLLLRDLGIFPRWDHPEDEEKALNWDDQETGYPLLELSHLLDVVSGILHAIGRQSGDFQPISAVFKSDEGRKKLNERIGQAKGTTSSISSWGAVRSRLVRLQRMRVFDQAGVAHLPYGEMVQPGSVGIVDLSDTDSVQVNNLAIAELLRGIQTQQEIAYEAAQRAGRQPTPVVVIIEEAHEFLSDKRIQKAQTLFQQVARIARRGRKRWLGLVFVTQLPQHLPDEVLSLLNSLIMHKLTDAGVIDRLRRSNIGGIDESLWRQLPSLAPGQAIVSLTHMGRPLLVAVDPCGARLRMVE